MWSLQMGVLSAKRAAVCGAQGAAQEITGKVGVE